MGILVRQETELLFKPQVTANRIFLYGIFYISFTVFMIIRSDRTSLYISMRVFVFVPFKHNYFP